MTKIVPVKISIIEKDFSQLDIQGVRYGLGAKAEGGRDPRNGRRFNPESNKTLRTPLSTIDHIDCSGYFRLAIARATDFKMIPPDGSQVQLQWCIDMGFKKIETYSSVNRYMTDKRLFASFIKPGHKGAGSIGHVWLVGQYDKDKEADTMESHGGVGINSRPWNYRTLYNQVYATFELPAVV